MRESIKVAMSGRFANEVVRNEIANDFRVALPDMIRLNIAFAVSLAENGLLDEESAGTIISGFRYVEKNMTEDDVKGELEDFYFNVERRMFEKVGSAIGGKLHLGRSRNDIAAVLNRMAARRSVWEVLELLVELQTLLLKKAEENTDTVITGYTHFQPGQPITLGHYYTALNNALSRDFVRIKNAYENANRSPYGAAAFAGTSFPIDREGLASLLGFDSVLENTLDCISARDYYLELASAFSIMATNISRAAEDLYFWSTFENGILEVGGEIAVCSSIMPQKRNPVSLEMARAKAGHIIGGQAAITTILKGTSFSNTMDLFEIPLPYWQMISQVKQMLICMIESVTYCRVNRERAVRQAAENLCTVTSLADYMVKQYKISFTDAHDIVGNIVSIVLEDKSLIAGFTPERISEESKKVLGFEINMSENEISAILDPYKNVETKIHVGGPSRESVRSMIKSGNATVSKEADKLCDMKNKVSDAYSVLEKKADKLAK